MSNKYLDILELQPGATTQEVKSAYRRLSKRYHPDISKDPNAKEKFIEITEAYQFLTQVGPTPHHEPITYNYNPEADEYEARRRQARARAKQKAREAERLQQELMQQILAVFDYIALGILAFNILLSLDYSLPRNTEEQQIRSITKVYERNRGNARYRYDEIAFDKYTMRFDKGEVIRLDHYDRAEVESTSLLGKPMRAVLTIDGRLESHEQIYNIYKVFGIIIPVMFLVVCLYRFVMKTLDAKLSLAILMVMLLLFQLYMFLKI
ncbi:hypothetical protein BFP72_12145 [Reichenbachiella sp. 5M10]|uniref:DnaJ domain-containing protein n=1 Tax=Reichenbachiella sp. 5M10 TaxID=1889772 RepID=UPI000C1598C4|nr:DnaJ domain-containing protein [Reichenbachiella sp. 5M10]PIB36091.1 hypothetical protein BFP72_12145 [Reichenbachiella sp. 5M10]